MIEPTAALVTAALFIGAELACKPTNDFADLVCGGLKTMLRSAFKRESQPQVHWALPSCSTLDG